MKHRHVWGALALLAFLVILVAVFSEALGADQSDDDREVVELSGTHDRQQFVAGSHVHVHDAQLRDVFAAGGEVIVERVQAHDVFAAGGSMRYRDTSLDDLVTVGGTVSIEAELRDDLIAAGGRVRIYPSASIAGDVVIAGGEVELAGDIGGNVMAAGGRVVLAGSVAGDVEVTAGKVVVEPGAQIMGKLVYRSDDAARIAPGSVVAGGVERKQSLDSHSPAWLGVGVVVAAILVAIIGAIVLGMALQAALPKPLHAALLALRASPAKSWLLGFAVLVATPVAANLLLATVIGLPLGLFVHAVYLVGLALALVVAAYWFGTLLRGPAARAVERPATSARMLRTALGMLALLLIGLVPVLGWLLLLVAVPLGAGALVASTWRELQPTGLEGRANAPAQQA